MEYVEYKQTTMEKQIVVKKVRLGSEWGSCWVDIRVGFIVRDGVEEKDAYTFPGEKEDDDEDDDDDEEELVKDDWDDENGPGDPRRLGEDASNTFGWLAIINFGWSMNKLRNVC